MKAFNHSSSFCVCIFCHGLCLLQGNSVYLNILNNSAVCSECFCQSISNRMLSIQFGSSTCHWRVRWAAFGEKRPFVSSERLHPTPTLVTNTAPFSRCVFLELHSAFCCSLSTSLPKPMAAWSITCFPSHSAPHSPKFLVFVKIELPNAQKDIQAHTCASVPSPPQCKRWFGYQALSPLVSLSVQTLYFPNEVSPWLPVLKLIASLGEMEHSPVFMRLDFYKPTIWAALSNLGFNL